MTLGEGAGDLMPVNARYVFASPRAYDGFADMRNTLFYVLFFLLACSTPNSMAQTEGSGILTINELRQINPMPSKVAIKGKITSIAVDGFAVVNKLDAVVVIDGVLSCYVKMPIIERSRIQDGTNLHASVLRYLYDQQGFILAATGGKLEILRAPETGSSRGSSRISKTLGSQFINSYSNGMDVVVSGDLITKPNGKIILRGKLRGLGSNPPK
jgi:hypothetical protein